MSEDHKISDERFRIDFVMTIKSFDEETGQAEIFLEPNPKRYEWKEVKGKRCLYDKYDNLLIPEDVLANSASKLEGMPIYYQPRLIQDVDKYIESRIPKIQNFLDEYKERSSFQDKSEEFLESLKKDQLAFVIMSIDIVGSTKLATSLEPKKYVKLISTLLFEMSDLIPKFHGYVLKYTGDGLLVYFPEPSFITKNDLAIDCASTIRNLVYKVLNKVLSSNKLPSIEIRIGLDSGDAFIETIGSPDTKQHKDIIGSVVSLAAKIQSQAKPGEIYLGNTVERNLHISWRQYCEPVNPTGWSYINKSGEIYQLFRLNT